MQRCLLLALAAAIACVSGVIAQEIVTRTAPIVPPTVATCHVSQLILDVDGLAITAVLKSENPTDAPTTKLYNSATVPTGATLLHNLNTGNFTVNSLIKAVYNRLNADGVCVGTVIGTPQ